MTPEERAALFRRMFGRVPVLEIEAQLAAEFRAIRQVAEQEAAEREREAWKKWLAQVRVAAAEYEFRLDRTVLCGEPTLEDAAQVGYGAAVMFWEAAIRARSGA